MNIYNNGQDSQPSASAAILQLLLKEWQKHAGLTKPPPEPILLWQDGERTIYIDETWGPPIPYPPKDHENGERNHGYVRVKGNLQVIPQIPEVRDWPELATFLEAVNSTASPIESMGCEKSYFPVSDRGAATVNIGAYVDTMLTNSALRARPEVTLSLASQLAQSVEGCNDWWGSLELGLQILRLKSVMGLAYSGDQLWARRTRGA